jgi:F-type H+-transporting ATPase subunit delta
MQGYSVVALRYAQSILHLSQERNEVEVIYEDMKNLSTAVEGSEELRSFLRSPVININTKKEVLQKVFTGKISEAALLFLRKLADVRRERYIGEIAAAYIHLYKKLGGVVTAEVITAVQLDDKLREEVRRIVKGNPEFAGASAIELNEKVDKNIIGGIVITVEDKQVDASFARKIVEFKRAFEENPYVKEF